MKAAPANLVELRDLRVHFPLTEGVLIRRRIGVVRAVDGVTLRVPKGGTVGLVGESGSGKSTLGRTVVALHRPTSGSVVFDGDDLWRLDRKNRRRIRRRFQMIFQDPYASLDPRMTLMASISEPLEIHGVGNRAERRRRVGELLERVGLNRRHADRFPHELSGGQRQRVGVARALALNPDLLVADEPVSALDVSIQAQIVNLLQELQREFGLTYILIAHDLSVVRQVSDVIAVMYLGRLVEVGETQHVYTDPRHPYTIALLSSVNVPDPVIEEKRERIVLQGDVPSAANPPAGCRFHPRCWLRQRLGSPEECVRIDPPMQTLPSGQLVACHFAQHPEEWSPTGGDMAVKSLGRPPD